MQFTLLCLKEESQSALNLGQCGFLCTRVSVLMDMMKYRHQLHCVSFCSICQQVFSPKFCIHFFTCPITATWECPSLSRDWLFVPPSVVVCGSSCSTDDTSIKARGVSISEALTNSPKTHKASIISRMAKMGQATLPLKGATVCDPSDSEEIEASLMCFCFQYI